MRILLTNDDGINAEGLAVLHEIAGALSDDVWICAPEYEQSGASRALTLSEPLRVRKHGPRKFSITGTPTDCVMLAMTELVEGARPDLVLSGVNHGQNLAEDVTMSGTVAGAIEGMALGVPSIALSQGVDYGRDLLSFDTARALGPDIVRRVVAQGWPKDVIVNVNFPGRPPEQVTAVEVTRQGFRDVRNRHAEKRTDLRGRDYYWMGFRNNASHPAEGTDLGAFYRGAVSITPLHIDLTHEATLAAMQSLAGPIRR